MSSPRHRQVFCNRTLNFKGIQAIGYDMDYTLIHYHVEEWEKVAYNYLRDRFVEMGWPVAHLEFDSQLVCRGLIVDTEKGNLVKANRFGFIKLAAHGTRLIEHEEMRSVYTRTIVELSDPRWVFLNTLFSISEGCFFAQLVDLLDARELPLTLGYRELYRYVRSTLDTLHMEGRLKNEILSHPDRFVDRDPEMVQALLDQKNSGKKLLLITNSEWSYTDPMMSYSFDAYLEASANQRDAETQASGKVPRKWRDLFDVIIVSARKPDFFTRENLFYEVVEPEGLLKPAPFGMESGKIYQGGSARIVEKYLKLSGDQILYVGDHMFGDVQVTKSVLRWRTALILRELEQEIDLADRFQSISSELSLLMKEKEKLEAELCQHKLALLRQKFGGPDLMIQASLESIAEIKSKTAELDEAIAPLAEAATRFAHPIWGPLLRAGNDKSHLAFQMERYADIYMSRVSSLLYSTPFVYLRSPRSALPHERDL